MDDLKSCISLRQLRIFLTVAEHHGFSLGGGGNKLNFRRLADLIATVVLASELHGKAKV